MTDTPEVLAALDAVIACEKDATPGKWFADDDDVHGGPDGSLVTNVTGSGSISQDELDALFIAASANLSRHAPAIKALVEENERLREALNGIRKHASNQDIGHLDFRVKAHECADAALQETPDGQ